MSRPRKRTNRPNAPHRGARLDLWAPTPTLDDPEPIRPPEDPAALLRSLGDPPLGRHSVPAGNALAAVVERASMLATALAASADLLADDEE